MDQFVIEGGQPLKGTVVPSGNKNAALPILAACEAGKAVYCAAGLELTPDARFFRRGVAKPPVPDDAPRHSQNSKDVE